MTDRSPSRRRFAPGLVALAATLGVGLAGAWAVRRHAGAGLLDRIDRVLAGGDHAIRLVAAARFGEDPAQRLQLFVPAAADPAHPLPILVFIHGGGWTDGDPHDYRFVARMLAPAGFAVALAGYRLTRAGRFPAMLEDGAAALGWLARHALALGGDPSRLVLIGHSAGAYNAMMLALDPRWRAQAGLGLHALRGVIGLAGPYDFLPLDDAATIAAFGHADPPETTQPIHYVRGDAPPVLLLHGTSDTRVYPRHSLALARALAGAGATSETHLVDGLSHEGLIMRLARPFARDTRVLSRVLAFAHRVTRDTPTASAPVQAPADTAFA